jgi:NAD-dependent SIR2 family protein deacetylase
MIDVKDAPKHSWNNHTAMSTSTLCGCYKCTTIMKTEEIEEWTDYGKTALCPKCGCDCIIPESTGIPMNEDSMKQIQDFWLK